MCECVCVCQWLSRFKITSEKGRECVHVWVRLKYHSQAHKMQHTLCSFDWTFYSFSPTHLQMCLSIVLKHQKLTYTHLLSLPYSNAQRFPPTLTCKTESISHAQHALSFFLSHSRLSIYLRLTASFFSSISRVWNTYTFTYAEREKMHAFAFLLSYLSHSRTYEYTHLHARTLASSHAAPAAAALSLPSPHTNAFLPFFFKSHMHTQMSSHSLTLTC